MFLIFLTVFSGLYADVLTLTIDDAVGRAVDQSLNIRKNAVDLAQAEYAANRLWSEVFPGFNLNTSFNFLPSTPLFTDSGFSYRNDALSYQLNLGLSLSLNPSVKSSMRQIELAYRSQLLSYENAVKQLEIQVIKSFLNLIARRANISLMEENLLYAENNLERAGIARASGQISELSWLNFQFELETARYNLMNVSGAYQIVLAEFLSTLGIEDETEVIFEGTIEIVPVNSNPDELIFQYLAGRPDIIGQRQIIERSELEYERTSIGSRSPSLGLSAGWRGNNGQGGLSSPFSDSITGSLTLTIPVDSWIPGTSQNQRIKTSAAAVEKAKLDLQNMEIQAKSQIRSIVSNLNNNLASLEIARLRVNIAERTAEAAEIGFRQGTVESRDLEDTRRNLSDTRLRLLQGEFEYQSLLLDLASALNIDWRLLTERIQENHLSF